MQLTIDFYENLSQPQTPKTDIYKFLIMKFNDVSEKKTSQLLDQLNHILDHETYNKLRKFLNQKNSI